MDLRRFKLSPTDVEQAKAVLGYQPFIITDSLVTGVACSWLHDEPEARKHNVNNFQYERQTIGAEEFQKAYDANVRLMKTYETYAIAISRLFAPGSYLDLSCNSGYMPVMASLLGMSECAGIDPDDHSPDFALLNRITGAKAEFIRGLYYSAPPAIYGIQENLSLARLERKFDVVSSMEFLCHLGDPLQFLYAVSKIATKAIFLWSGFLETDELLIRLNPPAPRHILPAGEDGFPWSAFASGAAMSTKLLQTTMQLLGFGHFIEIDYPADGLPPNFHERNMKEYQQHRAFLFIREPYYTEILPKLSQHKSWRSE